MSFWNELKRRNVVRVAIAYFVIGWLLLQIADTLAPLFDLPDGVNKFIFLLLLIGFVPVVVFAWAFELTPDGVKREKEVDRHASITDQTGRKLNIVTIVAAVLVAIMFGWQQLVPSDGAAPKVVPQRADGDRSIAVLAFADLSENGDQGYFADGMAEEILNVLQRLPDLRVAGRTSSFSFKGRQADVREISETLGVAHVLEGSVRRSGDQLRITAKLIRGADGIQLWSENYDSDVTDVFTIQETIAQSVAEKLATKFGLDGNERLAIKRTDDPIVYDNFLKAKQLFLKRGKDNLDHALLLLNEAIARDPEYAPAWTGIAFVYAVYEAYLFEIPDTYRLFRSIGEHAARRAIALDPDNAVAHGALGVFLDYKGDRIGAFKNIDRAVELSDGNDPDILDLASQHLQEAGYFAEARAYSERAIELDPLVAVYHNSMASTSYMRGDLNAMREYLESVVRLDPENRYRFFQDATLAVVEGDEQAVREATAFAVSTGDAPPEAIAVTEMFLSAWNDPDDLAALYGKDNDGTIDMWIALRLRDTKLALDGMEDYWNSVYRKEIGVFRDFRLPLVTDHPRWKRQVKEDGLLELWQERGFPKQCQAIGENDFSCNSLGELPENGL
ncbi:MAG: hypothetical protein AAGC71_08830 [Pseudomonadota bacterium]